MARPVEFSLSYFPFDTNFFRDRKIRRLFMNFGIEGVLIYLFILCEIYRDKGYYIKFSDDLVFDIADYLKTTEDKVNNTIIFCSKNELFHEEMFENGIITSKGVQKRFLKIKERNIASISEYNVLEIPQSKLTKNKIPDTEILVYEVKTQVNGNGTVISETEIQQKEIKVNNMKTNKELYTEFVEIINTKLRKVCHHDKISERQFIDRLNEGYSMETLINALEEAMKEKHHIINGYKFLTPEFITRVEKLNIYLNINQFNQTTQNGILNFNFESYEEASKACGTLFEITNEIDQSAKMQGGYKKFAKENDIVAIIYINQKKYFTKKIPVPNSKLV